MTGGLQEQVTDGEEWFGIGIEPASRSIIGSQDIPYIYEDRINKDEFIDSLEKLYNMSKEERDDLGLKGQEYVNKNYNFQKYVAKWRHVLKETCEKHGSWDNRKNYKRWETIEV